MDIELTERLVELVGGDDEEDDGEGDGRRAVGLVRIEGPVRVSV